MKDPKRDQDAERLRALLTAAAPGGPDDPTVRTAWLPVGGETGAARSRPG